MSTKNFIKTTLFLLLIIGLLSCQKAKAPQDKESRKTEIKSNKTLTIQVDGMTCTGCEATIENKVKGLKGIANVKAYHVKGMTKIEIDSSKVDKQTIVKAIESTGYTVIEEKQGNDK